MLRANASDAVMTDPDINLDSLNLNTFIDTLIFIPNSAHICGLMSNHLNFRLERIIALDPARPLIRPGNQNRLDTGDARAVQVIHTNAGYYGEGGRVGHIDFCVNGGRRCERQSVVDISFA